MAKKTKNSIILWSEIAKFSASVRARVETGWAAGRISTVLRAAGGSAHSRRSL